MNPAIGVWEKILDMLRNHLTETAVNTWFSEVEPVALEETRFVLYIPSPIIQNIVQNRYVPDIQKALYELFASEMDVLILGEGQREKYTHK